MGDEDAAGLDARKHKLEESQIVLFPRVQKDQIEVAGEFRDFGKGVARNEPASMETIQASGFSSTSRSTCSLLFGAKMSLCSVTVLRFRD